MDKKNKHGSIFKKLREERGYKSKDVAGDVISTRTLTRFEADETSLPIATFEKLLENCGVLPIDYLAYYNNSIEVENAEFFKRIQNYLDSGYSTKLINECKKELKKKDIDITRRIDILSIMLNIDAEKESELCSENKRIIMEIIQTVNKLGWNELSALSTLTIITSRKDFTVEYIDRIIEECIHNISTKNYLSNYISIKYGELLGTLLAFLSRNGYYSLAEKRCNEALNLFKNNPILSCSDKYYFDVTGILAMIYLRQNKKEGVELANRVLNYYNMMVEITDDPFSKETMDLGYKALCKVNKTGIDFEF
ncbi:helix-turn-helix domain-containing protein [Gemella sp.]